MTQRNMQSFLTEAQGGLRYDDLDLKKLEQRISSILKKNGLEFKSTSIKLQSVFGASPEIQMNVDSAKLDGTAMTRFSFFLMGNGDIGSTVSSKKAKHLNTFNRIGHIKSIDKLTERKGIIDDIIEFLIKEIRSNL